MPLELYATYSRNEALRSLDLSGSPQQEWGGRLVIGPEATALFVAVGAAERAPSFLTPDRFRFRPERPFASTVPGNDWLPEELASHTQAGGALHLLVQEGEGYFRFVGQLRLGMYTLPSDYRHQYADFDLAPRLKREYWLRYGGYPGWKLSLNHQEQLLDPGERATLDALLETLRDQEDLHLSLTRYEGDGLTLLGNESEAYVAYQNEWGGEEVVRNPEYPEDTEEVATFYCSCGAGLEMPRCSVVSRANGLNLVREFFSTGVRPAGVEWSEE